MNFADILVKYRSMTGNILLIVLLCFAEPDPRSITIGFFFILGGTFFRAWASGYISKDRELATNGPYSLTRNPLYFGNFILGTGIAIGGNNLVSYGIFVFYFLFFFPFLMIREHRRMQKLFKKKYADWAEKSNVFFPRIKKIRKSGFNISLYMKNREYRVIYFSLFVTAVLVFKYILAIRSN